MAAIIPVRASRSRLLILSALLICVSFLWFLSPHRQRATDPGPLTKRYIVLQRDAPAGGRAYIPNSWIVGQEDLKTSLNSNTCLDAAELALELAIRNGAFINGTKIPLIVHQTWKDFDAATWPSMVQSSVEDWLEAAVGEKEGKYGDDPEMAYILWDDGGIESLFETYEVRMWKHFQMLPYMVERTDAFRVAVLRWFGGIYADVDIRLLQHPSAWVQTTDLAPWRDPTSEEQYSMRMPLRASYGKPSTAPYNWLKFMIDFDAASLEGVGAIFGIECDSPATTDDYWRMGYSYPVQVTNWAMAMAPQHPVAEDFMNHLAEAVEANSTRLDHIDPLDLTGPPALTGSLIRYTHEDSESFDWNALSGLDDTAGGRGKVVAGDILVLPITAFSPGRGRLHNMGSMPIDHPNARLRHAAAGSWRKTDVKVHMGKLCRTVLGGCKDWSKIPEP